jgi:cbb3-type cytochrome oxidase subunit 3
LVFISKFSDLCVVWFRFTLFILLCILCLESSAFRSGERAEFENKANLALRQLGHALLLEKGDSTTSIPPVVRSGENEFSLDLLSGFDYAFLPDFLARALLDYGIEYDYEVMVRSCQSDAIVLGFNSVAVETDSVACKTRSEELTCAVVQVRFDIPKSENSIKAFGLFWLIIPAAGIGGFLFYRNKGKQQGLAMDELTEHYVLGSFDFDHQKQTLSKPDQVTSLTYRESKLLAYFAERPNKVLAREEIQSAVWGDEGVIVGRSLDVFVSRLRKLLASDNSVAIKTIHGVGYRLEVRD